MKKDMDTPPSAKIMEIMTMMIGKKNTNMMDNTKANMKMDMKIMKDKRTTPPPRLSTTTMEKNAMPMNMNGSHITLSP